MWATIKVLGRVYTLNNVLTALDLEQTIGLDASFDEVVVILFIAGPDQRTIPRQMFSGLREQLNPTILAVATLLVVLSIAFLATLELFRRRSQHLYRAHGGRGQAAAA